MKMMWRIICLGVLLLCGCYHTLELINIDEYSAGRTSWIPQKYKKIFIEPRTGSISSDRFEEEFVKALEERTEGQVKRSPSAKKNAEDLTLSFAFRESYEGRASNYLVSDPGFIIFTPAWYGYGYMAHYRVDVDIYAADNPTPVKSLSIPIYLEMRHADFGRTWAATGTGWFLLGLSACINGFYCTSYDTDITPELYERAFGRLAKYAADEVMREIRKIDFAAAAVELTKKKE